MLGNKYTKLKPVTIKAMVDLRAALVTNPSLSNAAGRMAFVNVFDVLIGFLPLPYQFVIKAINVGGGAPTWSGNCQIGYTYDNRVLTDEQLRDHLQKRDCNSNKHMQVPDMQVRGLFVSFIFYFKQYSEISGRLKHTVL